MRLIARQALNLVNCDDEQSFKNIWDKFTKTTKIGLSMESLNAHFFQFSAKIIKTFVLSS